MKILVFAVLAFAALVQGDLDWSNIKPKSLHVTPLISVPKPKIVGGWEAIPHSHPHQVSVVCSGAFCGGSLLTPNYVLTAAHCVDFASSCVVTAGAHEINKQESTQQKIGSKKIVIHQGWNPSSLKDDIAVVILQSNFELNNYVATIKPNEKSPAVGTQTTISGWGRPSDSSSGISPVLREAKDKALSNDDCKRFFGSYITPGHICFNGANGMGGCNGDSGGPMVWQDGGNIVQTGIASFVSGGGCESGAPTAYTRVSEYQDFINENRP